MIPYKALFIELAQEQKDKGLTPTCPRCGKDTVRHTDAIANAVSRYENVTICHICGEDEAMRELEAQAPLPAYQWHFIQESLRGRTFGDLLAQKTELDCSLIIGGVDMPADFVWYEENQMTAEGLEYYAEIMQAPYEKLPNGNIEIFCDNEEMGEDFCQSAAGYTGVERYNRYFGDDDSAPGESLDISGISLEDEPCVIGNCVNIIVSEWDALDARQPERSEAEDSVAHYIISYDTHANALKYMYWVLTTDDEESIEKIALTEAETATMKAALKEYFQEQYGCTILQFWRDRKAGEQR